MKKTAKKRLPPGDITKLNDFVRGFVSTGLISAIDQRAKGRPASANRRVLRHALQGGTALTAAVTAAHAVQRRDYAAAVTAAAVGAIGVYTLDCLLREETRETGKE